MKIQKAIKKQKKLKKRGTNLKLHSDQAGMLSQTLKTLAFWIIEDTESSDEHKLSVLRKILTVTDWELE